MNSVFRDIFKAIHEGKWLSIEYKNQKEEITKYWIGIKNIYVQGRRMSVEGLHLGAYTIQDLNYIAMDSILSSEILDGTYYPVNKQLVDDIYMNPEKYQTIFDHAANLKILNYLEDCNRLDTVPYKSEYSLIQNIDRETFSGDMYQLSDIQFKQIVTAFQKKSNATKQETMYFQQLAMNVLSIHMKKGLYVLAYKKMNLDVKHRTLRPDDEITICYEYSFDGKETESIRKYLDAEEYAFLAGFEKNQEIIKDCIQKRERYSLSVDDMKNLNHAMGNIMLAQNRYEIEKEVGIAHVFNENITYSDLFYSGRFDFVVYENHKNVKLPVLAIELDGKEHLDNEVVKHRDQKKNEICRAHNLQLIRVENCYARRYNYVKAILKQYFDSVK